MKGLEKVYAYYCPGVVEGKLWDDYPKKHNFFKSKQPFMMFPGNAMAPGDYRIPFRFKLLNDLPQSTFYQSMCYAVWFQKTTVKYQIIAKVKSVTGMGEKKVFMNKVLTFTMREKPESDHLLEKKFE